MFVKSLSRTLKNGAKCRVVLVAQPTSVSERQIALFAFYEELSSQTPRTFFFNNKGRGD